MDRRMKYMGIILITFLVLFVIGIYSALNINTRHYKENGELYEALHIMLPGYITIYHPEDSVDLQNWVGSKYDGFSVSVNGTNNAEATAGIALKATGFYNDYELKEINGHFTLYRPSSEERVFSTQAFYRIWFGKRCECSFNK